MPQQSVRVLYMIILVLQMFFYTAIFRDILKTNKRDIISFICTSFMIQYTYE